MTMAFFMEEIDRAYRVLGAQGGGQNWTDIEGWYKDGKITAEQRAALHQYNREVGRHY